MNVDLLCDSLGILVPDMCRELAEEEMTRPEVIELCQLAWRQLVPFACIEDSGLMLDALREPARIPETAIESLCAGEAPRREGWLEWFATVLACLILIRGRAIPLFGREWSAPVIETTARPSSVRAPRCGAPAPPRGPGAR